MHARNGSDGFDPGTYGRSFAEVYDRWYPADATTDAAVARIVALAGPGGTVLELGVGTGRLALPLAAAGLEVHGMDASAAMLEQLATKAERSGLVVHGTLGDVGDAAAWPTVRADVVVAAFNLVFNLSDRAAQAACFAAAAQHLTPGGQLLVEAFVPAPLSGRERRLEVREVTAEGVVLIATDADPELGTVTGQHIELVDGQPVRLRPWRIRVAPPEELDAMAEAAGLELVERHADWTGDPFDAHGAGHVSAYRRRG